VQALVVLKVFQKLSLPYTIINILFASLKLLTILKMLTETLLKIYFSVTGRCSPVSTSHWLHGISVKIAAFGSLKRVAKSIP
jgi:hypothetical protein